MSTIKQFIILICFFSLPLVATAAESKVTVEPLYGVETSLVRFPEPARYVTRATYGARVLYGTIPLSGEMEVTEAQSRRDYPETDTKIMDKSQRLALGIRSTLPLGPYVGIYGRAGGRASQGKTDVTVAGVTETNDNPLRVDPYAGAGLQVAFSSNFALNAGVTLIRNGENKYDSQYTLGISARIGKPQ